MKEKIQNDLSKKFSKGTVVIHWLTAILIIILFPMGKYMAGLEASEKMGMIKIHAALGIIIFVLTIIRTWLFFKAERPADLKTGSKFNDKLAVWIHNASYFLIFGIAVSGIASMILGGYGNAISSGNLELILPNNEIAPLKGHGIMAFLMMLLLAMHVLGAIKHYILTKENTLKRIF